MVLFTANLGTLEAAGENSEFKVNLSQVGTDDLSQKLKTRKENHVLQSGCGPGEDRQ